jgi:hypothetical protein
MTITERTRQHFVDGYRECIAQALSGELKVNDLGSFLSWQEANIASMLAGESDHTFAFRQRAHYLATGESVPLLGRVKK